MENVATHFSAAWEHGEQPPDAYVTIAAALETRVRNCLAHRPALTSLSDTTNGNQVRVRCLDHGVRGASKVIGFVHNPDSDPGALVTTAESLLRCIGANAGKNAPAHFVTDRWLVIVEAGMASHFDTYRQVCSQLLIPTSFARILVMSSDSRIQTLVG